MDSDLYRQRAKRRLVTFAVLAVIGGLLYWYLLPRIPSLPSIQALSTQVVKEISLPPPLLIETPPSQTKPPAPAAASTLTRAGIIADTNIQRKTNGGLPPLSENAMLDAIAAARAADMFQKQYFAHVAPDGGSAETTAKTFGYDYLALGENIALGVFAGDADLVAAWMGSPGHRANILNTHFTQIGVAARKGIFEGEETWIAVQVFGKPAAACPAVDPKLKAGIDAAQEQSSQLQAQIQAEKASLDSMEPKKGSAYNQKVDEYNALVQQYNALLDQTKAQVSQYNAEVEAFNRCVQAG